LAFKKIKSEELLPKIGSSVHIVGRGMKKTLGAKNTITILKIIVLSFKNITIAE